MVAKGILIQKLGKGRNVNLGFIQGSVEFIFSLKVETIGSGTLTTVFLSLVFSLACIFSIF